MIELFEEQIFDPACGSGGMFCQSARFVKEHQGNVRNISTLLTKLMSGKINVSNIQI